MSNHIIAALVYRREYEYVTILPHPLPSLPHFLSPSSSTVLTCFLWTMCGWVVMKRKHLRKLLLKEDHINNFIVNTFKTKNSLLIFVPLETILWLSFLIYNISNRKIISWKICLYGKQLRHKKSSKNCIKY